MTEHRVRQGCEEKALSHLSALELARTEQRGDSTNAPGQTKCEAPPATL